jgi:hypothetical protein
MWWRVVLAVALAVIAAGCGGSKQAATPGATTPGTTTTAAPTTTVDKCKGSKSAAVRARHERRLARDVARLRVLAAPIKSHTFNGTPALSRAVDRFLLDVADPAVPVLTRSLFINRAAAIVSPVCEQCFQALEASRPIAGGAKLGCG